MAVALTKNVYLPLFAELTTRFIKEPTPLIQVILGPRQIGKTHTVLNWIKEKKLKAHYHLGETSLGRASWIQEIWQEATMDSACTLLVIDEIQKIDNWSEKIKELWDRQKSKKRKLHLLLLGSSSLDIQRGLSESLTGRFELLRAWHWNYDEIKKLTKNLSIEEYLKFGGYPGSFKFIKNENRWCQYVKESIVETVITRDILHHAKVKSPALFRQLFYLLGAFMGRVTSYNKLLGQLQDRGNIDMIKYYLDLYEKAFLIKCVFKYSKNELQKKGSSPKIIFMTNALVSFHIAPRTPELMGHFFESTVGADLVRAGFEPYYWQEGDYEVDYILEHHSKVIAIEVKSGRSRKAKSLDIFIEKYNPDCTVFITFDNYEKFATNPRAFIEKLI
jgi:predicted AAA+ superfamily ATPase